MRTRVIGHGEELPLDTTIPVLQAVPTERGGEPIVVVGTRNGVYWSYAELGVDDLAELVLLLQAAGVRAFGARGEE